MSIDHPIFVSTNNGPHSAETWANVAATRLLFDDSEMAPERVPEWQRFQSEIIAHLTMAFNDFMQLHEQKIEGDPSSLNKISTAPVRAASVMAEIVAKAQNTSWADQFNTDEAMRHLMAVLNDLFLTAAHNINLWYCDAHPDDTHCKAYKSFYLGVNV